MIPRVRLRAITASLLFVPGFAFAQGVPDPSFNTIGTHVNLGALSGGVVDSRVTKTVTIRDAFNNAVAGATVVIYFSTCTSQDIRLAVDQPHHAGQIDCAAKTVSAITDASGNAVFRIAGGALSGPGNPPGAGNPGCALVRVDGVLQGSLFVGAYDNNLSTGVNPGDLSNWLGDRMAFIANPANYRGRSDFDGSATISPADASAILAASSSPNSDFSCGPTCL